MSAVHIELRLVVRENTNRINRGAKMLYFE